MEIIPAVLTNSPEEARALLTLCDGVSDRAQVDIIDGVYANNKTIFPEAFEEDYFQTKLDFHLMVKEPIEWISRCIRGNGDRIIGQIELMSDQLVFCNEVIKENILVGLALDLDTPVSSLSIDALAVCDVILVMSVQAGFGGQEYNSSALKKISELAKLRAENQFHFRICDDGGITATNEHKVGEAGADEIAVGRRLFEGDLRENIEHFRRASIR